MMMMMMMMMMTPHFEKSSLDGPTLQLLISHHPAPAPNDSSVMSAMFQHKARSISARSEASTDRGVDKPRVVAECLTMCDS
eukprot:2741588-Karenia_brevis.AAC.1